MAWETPRYSKSEVNKAGEVLLKEHSSKEEKEKATAILDNWRASHSYPLHVFQMRLCQKARWLDKNSLTAQRLKRVPSILFKLRRRYGGKEPSMKLSQMQDIGGCRVILTNVALARELCEKSFLKSELKHRLVNKKDYITTPKDDGYRSIHLIYAYKSDKKKKQEFNGLLTEIQIRSKLQHLWATAVETVGFMTRQSIKCSEGDKNWAEFFRLVSSAFARFENCPTIPGTPQEEEKLYAKIKEKERDLSIIQLLKGWTSAIKYIETKSKSKAKEHFYLLELDIPGEKVFVSSYTEKEKEKAILDYSRAEKKYQGSREYDVVLVGADTTNNLKKAYPNYFVDTHEFLIYLMKIVNKY